MNRWKGEQNVLCTYNGILVGCTKEGSVYTCYSIDNFESIMLNEISQMQKNNNNKKKKNKNKKKKKKKKKKKQQLL